MSGKRYQLNNSGCMVSAISNIDAPPVGTVWEPSSKEERDEAEALANVGYASETTADVTALTRAQTEAGITRRISGVANVIEQEDGTFKDAAGNRVHSDGSVFLEGDDDALALLDYGVNDVKAELGDLDDAKLSRLSYLEGIGKNRKGVLEAIGARQAELADTGNAQ